MFVDVTDVYETKLAACLAHRSQFPTGEESLEWMKELDQRHSQALETTYVEAFKPVEVW